MRITTNKFRCISSRLARPMLDLVSKKRPFLGCFRDDRPENSGRSPVCQVGVCNEGRCSSIAIGVSKDRNLVFNKARTMPWCHTVVHFEVKISCF